MYGLTRATVTLIAAAVGGLLIWLTTRISDSSNGGYWAIYGIIAGAGLLMALSQLLGGWTKWGWPRISIHVFLWAFVPVAVAVLWVVIFHQPHSNWVRSHIRSWSGDIGIDGLVRDFTEYIAVLSFGLGLVFGYTFDTTGPGERPFGRRRAAAPPTGAPTAPPPSRDREVAAERVPAGAAPRSDERVTTRTEAPAAEPPPREGPPG
jgi:hypothetical protein